MITIVDTAPIVASADRADPMGDAARRAFRSSRDELVVPAPVTQEVDYLLGKLIGHRAQVNFLAAVADGTLRVECLLPSEYAEIVGLSERYRALRPGLADLSAVVIAARLGTRRILTFDHRHFRAMRPLQGGSFTLLPVDDPG